MINSEPVNNFTNPLIFNGFPVNHGKLSQIRRDRFRRSTKKVKMRYFPVDFSTDLRYFGITTTNVQH
jgi:hypothetical protein